MMRELYLDILDMGPGDYVYYKGLEMTILGINPWPLVDFFMYDYVRVWLYGGGRVVECFYSELKLSRKGRVYSIGELLTHKDESVRKVGMRFRLCVSGVEGCS